MYQKAMLVALLGSAVLSPSWTKSSLVQQKIENSDTGTVFLLGADGLTVLRRPQLEEEYRALNFVN
jgi:hypothetical protein